MKCPKCESEEFDGKSCPECGEVIAEVIAEEVPEPSKNTIKELRKERVAFWNKKYKSPKLVMPKNRLASMEEVARMAKRNRTKGVLDLGCGRGEALEYMKDKHDFNVQGYEIVPSLCQHPLVDQFDGLHRIPEDSNSWDVVLLNCVLEHILAEDLQKALSEVQRVACKAVYIQVEWGKSTMPSNHPKLYWIGSLAQSISKRVHTLVETQTSARLLCVMPPHAPPPKPKANPLGSPVMRG